MAKLPVTDTAPGVHLERKWWQSADGLLNYCRSSDGKGWQVYGFRAVNLILTTNNQSFSHTVYPTLEAAYRRVAEI